MNPYGPRFDVVPNFSHPTSPTGSSSESVSSTEVVIAGLARLESFPIPEGTWKLDLPDVFEPLTLPEAVSERECGVCRDWVAEPEALSVSPCSHTFCKGCLHTYSTIKIRERQYPISCPTCLATGNTANCMCLHGIIWVTNDNPFSLELQI